MAGLKNNYQFEFTDTLTTSGTSVRISNEKENNAVATFTNQYITVRSEDNSIVERMKGSAAAGTLTLTMRGLDQSDTDTQDAGLKRERREGAKAFVTYVASQHVDAKNNNTFSGTQTFTNITVSNDSTLTNATVSGKYKGTVVVDVTARDALYPVPVDGNECMVQSLNTIQFYSTSAGGWQSLGVSTPVPDATEVLKGKARLATDAEVTAGTDDTTIVTPLKLKKATSLNYTLGETLTAGNVVSTDLDTNKIVRTYGQGVSATVFNTTAAAKTFDYAISLSETSVIYYTGYQIAGGYSKFSVSAGTVSGNIITVGASNSLWGYGGSTGTQFGGIAQIDTNKFIVIYAVNFNTANRIFGRACTVSGNTITLGAETELMNTASTLTRGSVTKVDTNKFAINYTYGANNRIMCCSVSGTTITSGGEYSGFAFLSTVGTYVSTDKIALSDGANVRLYTFSALVPTQGNNFAIGTTYTSYSLKDIGSSKSIFSGTNSSNSFAFIVDCSGTTPSKGTTVTVLNSSTTNDCCKVSNNQVCIVTGNNKYYFYNYSGTTLSPENNYTGTYSVSGYNSVNYVSSGLITGVYGSGVTSLGHITSNRIHNILGILQSSGVLNDVKTVKTTGGQSTIHTSLQPGRNIYLNNDGTIVYETGTFIGKTQSDTSILVGINYSAL